MTGSGDKESDRSGRDKQTASEGGGGEGEEGEEEGEEEGDEDEDDDDEVEDKAVAASQAPAKGKPRKKKQRAGSNAEAHALVKRCMALWMRDAMGPAMGEPPSNTKRNELAKDAISRFMSLSKAAM